MSFARDFPWIISHRGTETPENKDDSSHIAKSCSVSPWLCGNVLRVDLRPRVERMRLLIGVGQTK